jgi:DNA-binding NarL/FixJ family response regulator
MTEPIRLLLVDDHEMVLDSMDLALRRREGITIVATARSLHDAITYLDTAGVDVVVTDLDLGDGPGTELVAHANRQEPPVPVLLITGTDDRRGTEVALSTGCAGFVSKSAGIDELATAIASVARGAAVFPAALLSAMMTPDHDVSESGLSPRELEILQLLAQGRSAPEIGRDLHLSVHTVRNHIKQVLAKLDARSQLQAVVLAVRRGYVAIS